MQNKETKKSSIKEYIRTIPDYPVEGVNFYDLNSLFAGPYFNQAMEELLIKTKCRFEHRTPTHIVD